MMEDHHRSNLSNGEGTATNGNGESSPATLPLFALKPMPLHSTKGRISLKDTLNFGSEYMMTIDKRVRDVILLLGNTGAGKTTLVQMLAGDLSRMTAEKNKSGYIYIVDKDSRIGEPSTSSMTLIPELVLKKGGLGQVEIGLEEENEGKGTAFFDCGGFGDTRRPEEDLAVNFFLNQIAKKITRVKLLFIVNQSAVIPGNDRGDFRRLVSHGTKFLKNMKKYEKSIGLVVTKVQSYINNEFLDDDTITGGIAEFLEIYIRDRRSELELSSSELGPAKEEEIEKEIKFAQLLLEQDGQGNYCRIAFSRIPERVGPLSHSKVVRGARENVSELYSRGLKYAPVNWRDFGYTLKSKTQLNLVEYANKILNEEVIGGITILMDDFQNWYCKNYIEDADLQDMTASLQKVTGGMGELVEEFKAIPGKCSNPKQFLDKIKSCLECFGYSVPLRLENFMRYQQNYFEFFDEASQSPVPRSVSSWIHPVDGVRVELEGLRDWLEFCKDYQGKVATFDWQTDKPAPPTDSAAVNWLDFIARNDGKNPVPENIRTLAGKLGRIHLQALGRIMIPALRPVEVIYEEGVAITILGNFVRVAEVVSMIQDKGYKHVEVYAAHTLFIDDDIKGEGKELELVMISPNWVVIGGEKHFNLDGSPGPPRVPAVAPHGSDSTNGVGGNGHHAHAGHPGGSAGSFFGLAHHTVDIGKLKVTSVGGRGGDGQKGGNGGGGGRGQDATTDVATCTGRCDHVTHVNYTYEHAGYPGHDGGNGGDGGAGGKGGKGGKILFISEEAQTIQLVRADGSSGSSGKGGEGGKGGESGRGIEKKVKKKLYGVLGKSDQSSPTGSTQPWGADGKPGAIGASSKDLIDSKPLPYTIVEWKSILNFKYGSIHTWQSNTVAFIHFLEGTPSIRSYFGVEGFASELGKICELPGHLRNLDMLLQSYISRMETFAKENFSQMTPEQKKVTAYLLATAYSKLVAQVQDQDGMGMVVDLGKYFCLVRDHMNSLKQSSASAHISTTWNQFDSDFKGKIKEARGFLEKVVTPAVGQAEAELQTRLGSLEKQFEELILNSEVDLDRNRRRLENAIRAKEEAERFGVIGKVFGTVCKFSSLLGGISNFVDEGFSLVDNVGDSLNGIMGSFQGLVTNVGAIGSGGGCGQLVSTFKSGKELLRSASDLAASVKAVGAHVDRGIVMEEPNSGEGAGQALQFLGEKVASNLSSRSGSDDANISRLEDMVREAELRLGDARHRQVMIERSFIPMVEAVNNSLEGLMTGLQSKSEGGSASLSQLGIGKWQVKTVLRDVKLQLEILGRGIETRYFANSVDMVQDALTMTIDLFDHIVKYEENRKQVEYMAVVSSAALNSVHVTNSKLSSALVKMEKALHANSFAKEYQRALHAFKQWVFPFAKLHLTPDLMLEEGDGNSILTLGEEALTTAFMKQMDRLQNQLKMYKATTLNTSYDALIRTNFSSELTSSSPFFVWKNENFAEEIAHLLAGHPVMLKADIRSSPKGMDAIKFQQVEINLKIRDGEQTDLNSELERFGVQMTHSGLSHYRFQGNFYVMTTGSRQTIRYNFERDGQTGRRLGTNTVYDKFSSGDYLLSPYTLWEFQLVRATPMEGEGQFGNRNDFRGLARFAPCVDLELVGTGNYVDGGKIGEDMEVGKYYVRDDSVKEIMNI